MKIFSFFLLILFFTTPVLAADFDLGLVNFPDPVIKVTYNEPVQILDAQTNLIFLETNTGIGLAYDPSADDGFANEYEIRPSAGELGEGRYSFEVVARSTLGLTNSIPDTVEFSVTGLNAMMLSPASGFAQSTPYSVNILTFVYGNDDEILPFNAECKYFLGQNPPNDFNHVSLTRMSASTPSGDPNQHTAPNLGTRHKISGLETTSSTLSVLCQRYKLSRAVVPRLLTEQFSIGVLEEGPTIVVTLTPPTVFNEQDPTLSLLVETNQDTICTIRKRGSSEEFFLDDVIQGDFDTYKQEHLEILDYSSDEGINEIITSTERQEKEYTIQCTNLAGRSTQEDILVTIDYDAIIEISIIEPEPLTNADPVVIRAQTNIFADCELDGEFMNQEGTIHSRQVSTNPSQDYTTTITCTQQNKETTIEYNFTTDRIPPNNILINASEAVCGNTATAFFEAEDNDQVHGFNWTLKDGSTVLEQGYSTSGFVEVTTPSFTSQELTWEVDVHDRAGNIAQANPVTTTLQELNSDACNPGPFIQYYEPPLGFDTDPFDITIQTKREAICGFRLDLPGIDPNEGHQQAQSTDGFIHELFKNVNTDRSVHIRCVEDDETIHTQVLDFGITTQRPSITELRADPNPVNDFTSRKTTITATTNTETVCQLLKDTTVTFDGEDLSDANTYTTDHEHELDLSEITSQQAQVLDYRVVCTDKAGQIISKALPITIDFSNTEIEVLSPQQYTNNPQPDVIVRPSATSICEYRDPDSGIAGAYNSMTADDQGVHAAGLLVTLDEGAHSILVRCTNSLAEQSFKTISFSVDTIAPIINPVANDFVCKDATTTIEFNITDNSPVTTQITIDTNTTNTTADRYELDSTLYNDSVSVQFTPIDAAGNTGTSETKIITVYENGALECTNRAICGDGTQHEDEACDDGNLISGDGCSDTCTIEQSNPVCGNGVAETGELCDGDEFAASCSFFGLEGTPTSCNNDCTPDLSTCSDLPDPALCGNGVLDNGEFCDGVLLGSASCSEVGLSGTFDECTPFCTPVLSSCSLPPVADPTLCGNGELNEGEECDDSEFAVACSIYGREGSASSCTSICKLDVSTCGPPISVPPTSSVCGNNIVETGEECDGTDLPLSSCQFYNPEFSGTISSCNADCTYDTSTCNTVLGGPGNEGSGGGSDGGSGSDSDGGFNREERNQNNPPTEIEEGFSWLALILMILGVVLMGGSGYYLYTAYDIRSRQEQNVQRQDFPQRPPQLTQEQIQEQQRLEQEKLENYRQREQEREAKRAKIMSSFDDGTQKQDKEDSDQVENNQENESKQNNAESKTITKESSEQAKKKKDAFSELDEFVDETKGGK